MQEERNKEILEYIDFKYVVGGVTILGGLVGLYFAYKKNKREIKEEAYLEKEEEEEENKKIKSPVKKKQKRCYIENL